MTGDLMTIFNQVQSEEALKRNQFGRISYSKRDKEEGIRIRKATVR